MRVLRRLIFVIVAGFVSIDTAGNPAEQIWRSARLPFIPMLTTNADPAVCGPFLAAIQEAFRSDDFRVRIADRNWPGAAVEWVFSPGRNTEDRSGYSGERRINIVTRVAALGGDQPQLLVLLNRPFGWQDSYALLRVDSQQAFDELVDGSDMTRRLAESDAALN